MSHVVTIYAGNIILNPNVRYGHDMVHIPTRNGKRTPRYSCLLHHMFIDTVYGEYDVNMKGSYVD